ncbi:holin [Streptomyces sp. bgisy154]|uniref:holin n=1 Tax=Streptomyces sp. bgisy154 TaxID=3413794 RepID=UPI003D71663D
MGRRSGWRVCTVPGCPEFTQGGRCPEHQRAAEKKRGTARQRGYGGQHETRFRPGVLAKNPTCVLCGQAPSVHADHHPLSRRDLEARGLDPNDPRHGRGLCSPCHSGETAKHQPGGWNA